ncbi:hypothetical protein Plhal304r1_c056g0141471 [Plasmopara halstedii]
MVGLPKKCTRSAFVRGYNYNVCVNIRCKQIIQAVFSVLMKNRSLVVMVVKQCSCRR